MDSTYTETNKLCIRHLTNGAKLTSKVILSSEFQKLISQNHHILRELLLGMLVVTSAIHLRHGCIHGIIYTLPQNSFVILLKKKMCNIRHYFNLLYTLYAVFIGLAITLSLVFKILKQTIPSFKEWKSCEQV